MNHKRLITISASAVLFLALITAFAYLTRVRYVYVKVGSDGGKGVYEYCKTVLGERFYGRSFLFFKTSDVEKALSENPYVEVKSVKKVFPDCIRVEAEEREERFVAFFEEKYYYLDSGYKLLRVSDSRDGSDVTEITLTDVEFDPSATEIGKSVVRSGELFSYAARIYDGFSDPPNFVSSVAIDGKKQRIYFKAKTGVTFSFRIRTGAEEVTESVEKAEKFYSEASESEKSDGFIIIYLKDGEKTAAVEWISEEF